MRTLMADLRYGVRMLLKSPVVSGIAALSLALGIAAATAIFSLASGFWLDPLPFGDQDGLVMAHSMLRERRPPSPEERRLSPEQ